MKVIDAKEGLEILKVAYAETVKRNNGYWKPIASTKKQLEYCMAAILKQNDREKLSDIMFYQYAVHEFENSDPKYAELLHKAAGVVDLMIAEKI